MLQVCPPFVVDEDEVTLIADTIAAALDTLRARYPHSREDP
jgi:hypothetical protein